MDAPCFQELNNYTQLTLTIAIYEKIKNSNLRLKVTNYSLSTLRKFNYLKSIKPFIKIVFHKTQIVQYARARK